MRRDGKGLWSGIGAALVGLLVMGGTARAATCQMSFQMKGWAAFYEKADGHGVVTCDNGQQAYVKLEGRGGGLSAGKWEIRDGRGTFSGVSDINEVFGDYASTNASASAGPGGGVRAMTKGNVSLAISGKGSGVDLSAGFGRFRVRPE